METKLQTEFEIIDMKTENIPLSMKEVSTSYFFFFFLFICRGIRYGAAYGSVLFLAGFVAVFGLPILLIEFFENRFRKRNRASLAR